MMVPIKTKKSPRATERATMVMVLGDAIEPQGSGPSEALWLWLPARVGGSPSPLKAVGIKLQRQEDDSRRGFSLLHSATPGS